MLLTAFCAWYFRPVTLNIGLYAYVPDKARFENQPAHSRDFSRE